MTDISNCPACGQQMHPTDWKERMQECLRQAEADLVKAREDAGRSLIIGVEYGYKACERGDNLQLAIDAARSKP